MGSSVLGQAGAATGSSAMKAGTGDQEVGYAATSLACTEPPDTCRSTRAVFVDVGLLSDDGTAPGGMGTGYACTSADTADIANTADGANRMACSMSERPGDYTRAAAVCSERTACAASTDSMSDQV